MLVITRFAVAPDGEAGFRASAHAALAALAVRPGWRGGRIGRAVDDAGLWLLVTDWDSVGAWRRALGGYDVKLAVVPLLMTALDEPSAFEVLYDAETGWLGPSDRAPDADSVNVGEAAGPGSGWTPEQP